MTVYTIIIFVVSFSSPLMTYPVILCLSMSFVLLLSSLQLSLLFFLPLFSAGSSLPTEHSSCVLVLLRRWKIGLRY